MTRYVGIRCPVCGSESTLHQEENIQSTWWHDHRLRHFPLPIIETRPSPDIVRTPVQDES